MPKYDNINGEKIQRIDRLIENSVKAKSNVYDPPVRANGESWGFVGYEIFEYPEDVGMSQNGNGDGKNMLWVYGEFPPNRDEILLLCDCIRNKRHVTSFSDIEKNVWENIEGKFAHTSDSGEIVSDVLVLTSGSWNKIGQRFGGAKTLPPLILLRRFRSISLTCPSIRWYWQ